MHQKCVSWVLGKVAEAVVLLSFVNVAIAAERSSSTQQIVNALADEILSFDFDFQDEKGHALFSTGEQGGSKIYVEAEGQKLGFFKEGFMSLGTTINVTDANGKKWATLKGDAKKNKFIISNQAGAEIGSVALKIGNGPRPDEGLLQMDRSKVTDAQLVMTLLAAAVYIFSP